MSNPCLFCDIIKGDVPTEKVFENDKVLGFTDISPMSKIHLLFVHKEHTKNVNEIANNSPEQLIDIYKAIAEYTQENGLADGGFRVVTNQGQHSGQAIFHTHFHVLAGEQLGRFGAKNK